MMQQFKEKLSRLDEDVVKVQRKLNDLKKSNSTSPSVIERGIDDYMCEVETLCIRSRILLDGHRQVEVLSDCYTVDRNVKKIAGDIEITHDGWLHITLNTLLPNCRYKTSGYVGDTLCRLMHSYDGDLPYFETAFLAIVEYCNSENHNALDNDNKGWKMIPNALKGRVIEDDNQFVLSIGLFAKLSDEPRCEIYVLPPEDGVIFMDLLEKDML